MVPIKDAGVETEVCTNLLRRILGNTLRNFTVRVLEIAKQHGTATGIGTGLHTGGLTAGIHTMDAQCAAFNGTFTSRCVGFLVLK